VSTKIGATTMRTGRPFLRHFSRPQVLGYPHPRKGLQNARQRAYSVPWCVLVGVICW